MKKFIQDLIEMGADFSTKRALKRSLKILGVKPENVDRLYIDFKNDHYREDFSLISPKFKIIFLPQCLRKISCRALLTESGYKCTNCSPDDCKVYAIKSAAEKKGYRVFICPGGTMVFKIIRKLRPKAVLGVACLKELVLAAEELRIPMQGIELLKNGCVNTDVDLEQVLSFL
ncbi:MAG: DUF116 domain-containing protein [Candidatus Aenigmatarchaeota archaeon]